MRRRRVRPVTGPGESVATTLRQLVRAIAGGLLLGLPPLFTMEMWFKGFLLHSWKIVALVVFTFVIVIGYSAFAGFRRERTWPDLIIDSVQTMGIAAVVAAGTLWLLGRIDPGIGLRDAIVALHLDRAYMTAMGWVLPASVTNEGDRSAQAVTLIAIATVDGDREDAEITVDYLPAGTQVDLAVGFSGEPDGEVRVRVTGYLP